VVSPDILRTHLLHLLDDLMSRLPMESYTLKQTQKVLLLGLIASCKMFLIRALDEATLTSFLSVMQKFADDDEFADVIRARVREYLARLATGDHPPVQ
jgi:transcriptional regulator NrdR family protein